MVRCQEEYIDTGDVGVLTEARLSQHQDCQHVASRRREEISDLCLLILGHGKAGMSVSDIQTP